MENINPLTCENNEEASLTLFISCPVRLFLISIDHSQRKTFIFFLDSFHLMDNEEILFHIKRSFEKVRADIKTHEAYIEALRAENQMLKMQLQQLIQHFDQKKAESKLQQEVFHYVKRRNKVFIKQKILSFLATGPRPVSEIKEIIVDKEECCSKASFYRYIEDMKRVGALVFVETDRVSFASLPPIKTTN